MRGSSGSKIFENTAWRLGSLMSGTSNFIVPLLQHALDAAPRVYLMEWAKLSQGEELEVNPAGKSRWFPHPAGSELSVTVLIMPQKCHLVGFRSLSGDGVLGFAVATPGPHLARTPTNWSSTLSCSKDTSASRCKDVFRSHARVSRFGNSGKCQQSPPTAPSSPTICSQAP